MRQFVAVALVFALGFGLLVLGFRKLEADSEALAKELREYAAEKLKLLREVGEAARERQRRFWEEEGERVLERQRALEPLIRANRQKGNHVVPAE